MPTATAIDQPAHAFGLRLWGRRFALILDQQDIDVFIGLDVGKSDHHAVALDTTGKRLYDRTLPNDEAKLKQIQAERNKARLSFLLPRRLVCSPRIEVPERRVTGAMPA